MPVEFSNSQHRTRHESKPPQPCVVVRRRKSNRRLDRRLGSGLIVHSSSFRTKNKGGKFQEPVHVHNWSAFEIPLEDESIDCVHIDPPYYDSVPYADLSDFFIVWLKRLLYDDYPEMLKGLSPKGKTNVSGTVRGKSTTDYEDMMAKALGEIHRVLTKNGILCLVFASKSHGKLGKRSSPRWYVQTLPLRRVGRSN